MGNIFLYFTYDANGNLTDVTVTPGPNTIFQASYDPHNQLEQHRATDSGNYNLIEYDSVGRVWKRTDTSSTDTFYYHDGNHLMQELDTNKAVTTDYMADSRRYMPDEITADKTRYYTKDHLGSVMMMQDKASDTQEKYELDAWGEPAAPVPTTENKVRYAGARTEMVLDAGGSDAIYKMGKRHYWPNYHRFIQRDPLSYRSIPDVKRPLSLNPYIYAENNPVMNVDPTGVVSVPHGHFVRGCKIGSSKFHLGSASLEASQYYDCCHSGGNIYRDRDGAISQRHVIINAGSVNTNGASKSLAEWKKLSGQTGVGLCSLDMSGLPPKNPNGPAYTTVDPYLCCFYVQTCMNTKCPPVCISKFTEKVPGPLLGMASMTRYLGRKYRDVIDPNDYTPKVPNKEKDAVKNVKGPHPGWEEPNLEGWQSLGEEFANWATIAMAGMLVTAAIFCLTTILGKPTCNGTEAACAKDACNYLMLCLIGFTVFGAVLTLLNSTSAALLGRSVVFGALITCGIVGLAYNKQCNYGIRIGNPGIWNPPWWMD